MPAFLRSPRAVALSTILLLILLDVARSVVGHFGYLTPVSVWHPDPAAYDGASVTHDGRVDACLRRILRYVKTIAMAGSPARRTIEAHYTGPRA